MSPHRPLCTPTTQPPPSTDQREDLSRALLQLIGQQMASCTHVCEIHVKVCAVLVEVVAGVGFGSSKVAG